MVDLNKDQKNILSLYGLFGAGSLMMVIPLGIIPFAGLACALVVFFAACFYRWRKKDNDLFKFHMTHIIRTTWWSQLILFVGAILLGTIVYNNGDITAINTMATMSNNGVVPDQGDIAKMQLHFFYANKSLIVKAGLFCLLPYPIYLLYRIIKGVKILTKKEG